METQPIEAAVRVQKREDSPLEQPCQRSSGKTVNWSRRIRETVGKQPTTAAATAHDLKDSQW